MTIDRSSWFWANEWDRDRLLRSAVEEAAQAQAESSRRMSSQISRLQGTIDKRLNALTAAFDAHVELTDVREELRLLPDWSSTRRAAAKALDDLAAGRSPERLDTERHDHWIAHAMNAVIALAAGRRDEASEREAEQRSSDAGIFIVVAALASGHGESVVDRLPAVLVNDGTLTPVQQEIVRAIVFGLVGHRALGALHTVVQNGFGDADMWRHWLASKRSPDRTNRPVLVLTAKQRENLPRQLESSTIAVNRLESLLDLVQPRPVATPQPQVADPEVTEPEVADGKAEAGDVTAEVPQGLGTPPAEGAPWYVGDLVFDDERDDASVPATLRTLRPPAPAPRADEPEPTPEPERASEPTPEPERASEAAGDAAARQAARQQALAVAIVDTRQALVERVTSMATRDGREGELLARAHELRFKVEHPGDPVPRPADDPDVGAVVRDLLDDDVVPTPAQAELVRTLKPLLVDIVYELRLGKHAEEPTQKLFEGGVNLAVTASGPDKRAFDEAVRRIEGRRADGKPVLMFGIAAGLLAVSLLVLIGGWAGWAIVGTLAAIVVAGFGVKQRTEAASQQQANAEDVAQFKLDVDAATKRMVEADAKLAEERAERNVSIDRLEGRVAAL